MLYGKRGARSRMLKLHWRQEGREGVALVSILASLGGGASASLSPEVYRYQVSDQFNRSSGMGRPAKSRLQGLAIRRAHWAERLTRALSVAIPVFAYIWR